MLDRAALVEQKLGKAMLQMCQVSWMFSKHPGMDFSRDKKDAFFKSDFISTGNGRRNLDERIA